MLYFYFFLLDFKKTRFFFVIFLSINRRYHRFNRFLRRFRIITIDFNFRSSYFSIVIFDRHFFRCFFTSSIVDHRFNRFFSTLSHHDDRFQSSIVILLFHRNTEIVFIFRFFSISKLFFFEFLFNRIFFMKNPLISITIELTSIESSTKSTSIFSTFVFFFEKTISRISSNLTKFFVFFFRSNFRSHFRLNLLVFQLYNFRKVIAMNFDIKFIHNDKRISNKKISLIKQARIDKNKNRHKNDLHFIVEFLRRHSTKNRIEIKIKIIYIKTYYQKNCIILLFIIQNVVRNLIFFQHHDYKTFTM